MANPVPAWRDSMERIANQITSLWHQKATFERFSELVRANPSLLSGYNPFLDYVRRWYGLAVAVLLRRQVDSDPSSASLRGLLDSMLERVEAGDPDVSVDINALRTDLAALRALSDRFRQYFNAAIHGQGEDVGSLPTYNELGFAVDELTRIGERYYLALLGVSRRLSVVEQFDWTDIFKVPWIADENAPYKLGDPGVPYDALPPNIHLLEQQPYLRAELTAHSDEFELTVRNEGHGIARNVAVFVPYANPIEFDKAIPPKGFAKTRFRLKPSIMGDFRQYAQVVIEFEDTFGFLFRQFANSDVNIPPTVSEPTMAYRVSGRIVGRPRSA